MQTTQFTQIRGGGSNNDEGEVPDDQTVDTTVGKEDTTNDDGDASPPTTSTTTAGAEGDAATTVNSEMVDGGMTDGTTTAPPLQQQQPQVGNTNGIKTKDDGALKLHQKLFPIYGHERKKFILMGCIKFFIIMALTLTRDTKDTMVVTQCGAEAIAFLKIYGVLPAATGFIALYARMSSSLGKRTLFFSTCIPFFVFFFAFDAFIYPNRMSIQPSLMTVQSYLGGGDGSDGGGAGDILSRIVCNWTSALYFIVAELYSSASVGILFWQFANDVVSVDQAKRFYPLFSQMGGLAPIVAGQYVARYASKAVDFQASLHRLTIAVTLAGVGVCVFYYLSSSLVEKERRARDVALADGGGGSSVPTTQRMGPKKKNKKNKMSMSDSITCLASSQYLRLILTLVVGYGLSISFTEITWKSLLKKKYPNPLDYQRFMGNFSSAVGLATCTVILFGVHVIRVLGWRVGAMATPAAMGILAIPFFACILLGVDDPARLQTAIAIGTIQSLLSKTSKYALFDPTTQMAYIPLDDDSKVRGKAAIEVLGSRLGKSGGSFLQQGLIFIFGNILNAGWAVAFLFYAVVLGWLGAADRLSGLFLAKTEMQKAELRGE